MARKSLGVSEDFVELVRSVVSVVAVNVNHSGAALANLQVLVNLEIYQLLCPGATVYPMVTQQSPGAPSMDVLVTWQVFGN